MTKDKMRTEQRNIKYFVPQKKLTGVSLSEMKLFLHYENMPLQHIEIFKIV